MRTSGGRGGEGWIMAIPIIALLVVSSMSAGGLDAMLVMLERTIRETLASVGVFIRNLF